MTSTLAPTMSGTDHAGLTHTEAPSSASTPNLPGQRMSDRTIAVLVTPLLILTAVLAALGLAYMAGAATTVLQSIG